MSDYELLIERKRLQTVQPVGVDIDRNGPALIELIRFTLGNIE